MKLATLADSSARGTIARLIPRDVRWGFGSAACVAGRDGPRDRYPLRPQAVVINGREEPYTFAHVELLGFGLAAVYEFTKGRPFVRVALYAGRLRVRYRRPS